MSINKKNKGFVSTRKITSSKERGKSQGKSNDVSRRIGDLGENIAVAFLEKRGFQIIDRNYSNIMGEIDIIAQKDEFYYIIEVKTLKIPSVSNEGQGGKIFDPNISIIRDGEGIDWLKPENYLAREKIKRIKYVAMKYCMDFGVKEENLKFLGISVSLYHYGSRVTKNSLMSCKVKVLPILN